MISWLENTSYQDWWINITCIYIIWSGGIKGMRSTLVMTSKHLKNLLTSCSQLYLKRGEKRNEFKKHHGECGTYRSAVLRFWCTGPPGTCLHCRFLASALSSSGLVDLGWAYEFAFLISPSWSWMGAGGPWIILWDLMRQGMAEWNGFLGDPLSFSSLEHIGKTFLFYFI